MNITMESVEVGRRRARWLAEAKKEAEKQRSLRNQRGRGSCVLFILDISESMQGEGIQCLKRGVADILDEFTKHPSLDENVSVIVFGEETKFLHYYSNDYAALKYSIGNLECAGPSPLTAAFLLALGGLFEGSAHTQRVGDFLLMPRVVLFTDGRPTDFCNENATEQDEQGFLHNSILAPLFSIVDKIGQQHPIFCFPVGKNPNNNLLNAISSYSSGGRVLEIHKASWFGRYTLHYETAGQICRITTGECRVEKEVVKTFMESLMSWNDYEKEDVETIHELVNNKSRIMAMQESIREDPEDKFYKEKFYTVPKLGTRVRRGPHWIFENQDSEGPGTIVGHGDSDGLVHVEWDNGIRANYSHGCAGIYNVVVCDEPRVPVDGLPAVGCFVKRGPDWKWEDQDGGEGSIGTVYKAMDDATVYVRWPCGRKGNYRFGYDGKFDIDVCDPFSPEIIQAVKEHQEDAKHSHPDRNSSNDLKANHKEHSTSETKVKYERMAEEKTNVSTNYLSPRERALSSDKCHYSKRLHASRRKTSNTENDIVAEVGFMGHFTLPGEDDESTDLLTQVCVKNVTSGCAGENSPSDIETDEVPEACSTPSANPEEYHNDLLLKEHNVDHNLTVIYDNVESGSQTENQDSACRSLKNVEKLERATNLLSQNIANSEMNSSRVSHFWQWLDKDGVWMDYPDHVNNQINLRLQQRPDASVVVSCNNQCFRVIVSKSVQINIESKERHQIRLLNTS